MTLWLYEWVWFSLWRAPRHPKRTSASPLVKGGFCKDLPRSPRLSSWNSISSRTRAECRWCRCGDCEVLPGWLGRLWIRGRFSLWLPSPRVWRLRRALPLRLEWRVVHRARFQGHPEYWSILQEEWCYQNRKVWFGLQRSLPLYGFAELCHWEVFGDHGPSSAHASWRGWRKGLCSSLELPRSEAIELQGPCQMVQREGTSLQLFWGVSRPLSELSRFVFVRLSQTLGGKLARLILVDNLLSLVSWEQITSQPCSQLFQHPSFCFMSLLQVHFFDSHWERRLKQIARTSRRKRGPCNALETCFNSLRCGWNETTEPANWSQQLGLPLQQARVRTAVQIGLIRLGSQALGLLWSIQVECEPMLLFLKSATWHKKQQASDQVRTPKRAQVWVGILSKPLGIDFDETIIVGVPSQVSTGGILRFFLFPLVVCPGESCGILASKRGNWHHRVGVSSRVRQPINDRHASEARSSVRGRGVWLASPSNWGYIVSNLLSSWIHELCVQCTYIYDMYVYYMYNVYTYIYICIHKCLHLFA